MWLRFAMVIENSGVQRSHTRPAVKQGARPLLECWCCDNAGMNRVGGTSDHDDSFIWWADLCGACTDEFFYTWNMVGRSLNEVRYEVAPRMKVLSMIHDWVTHVRRSELPLSFEDLCWPCGVDARKMYEGFVSKQKDRVVMRWCVAVRAGLDRDVVGCIMRALWLIMMDERSLLDA